MWDAIMRHQIEVFESQLAIVKNEDQRTMLKKMIAGKEANLDAYLKR